MNDKFSIALVASVVLAGCATQGGSQPATPVTSTTTTTTTTSGPTPKMVKSRDGSYEGEVVGTIAPDSKFSKLQIGMEFNEVSKLIGGGASMDTHETGKRWIPFYYGNDARRMEVQYPGEGCLTFTGGNIWGGGGNELIRITADPSGALCKD